MNDRFDSDRLRSLSEAVARVVGRVGQPLSRIPTLDALRAQATAIADAALLDEDPPAAIRRGLRALKYPLVASLILRDHEEGLAALEAVTRALTDLADALVEGALRFARASLEAKHGCPPGEAWSGGGGFVVFAMGKHGAGELNYSSDIDLVYVVGDARGTTAGPRPISTERFSDRLGRQVKAILEDRTADGFCFRVDLNLRPEGVTGPLTTGMGAAEHYFLNYGRTWERAAWLKARPCAGDLTLGAELLSRIEPFRFRRGLDFGTLEDIGAMRDRIAAAAGGAERDLKRGPGGIRELEFLVQAGQLVWSGRDRRLRGRRTLEALYLLEERDALPVDATGAELEWAYRVLRAVEHRLQWPQEAQTQTLPKDDDSWAALARAYAGGGTAGRDEATALRDDLAKARALVSAAWAGMFAGGEAATESLSMDTFAHPEEHREALKRLGFDDPEEVERRLRRLSAVGGTKRMRPETYRRFERVMPRMLALAAASEEPSVALGRLEAFTARVGARGATYTLLHEAPAAAETLVRLFGSSGFLAEQFIAHPELLDTLLLRGGGGEVPPRDVRALFPLLEADLDQRPDVDEAITALRTFKTAEILRIALADLGGALPAQGDLPGLPSPWLSAVAACCVRGACRVADRAMEARHGRLREGDQVTPFAVVGLGSLGSGWMSYGSDVDLVFVYDPRGIDESDGGRRLDRRTWAARWSQRVVTNLTAATREGRCYDVDLRLRPGGKGGPVITTLGAFRQHWLGPAEIWERIALSRASVVAASSPAFGVAVQTVIEAGRRSADPEGVRRVAAAMRARQRAEIAGETADRWNLKVGDGGITDVEFVAAVAQLTTDVDDACPVAVLQSAPLDIDGPALVAAYRFLRRAEARVRLRSTTAADIIDFASPDADRLARSLGYGSKDALREELGHHRRTVSSIAARILRPRDP
jgi:[glutamine synthetase] adenylyltransferase / [glutamine synthetase]-adenylyl-L-tyrosine phosphorylase